MHTEHTCALPRLYGTRRRPLSHSCPTHCVRERVQLDTDIRLGKHTDESGWQPDVPTLKSEMPFMWAAQVTGHGVQVVEGTGHEELLVFR